ncbi:MAG: hypothetical protein ABI863_04770 [Ginsengibacter sp.]
MIDLSKREKKIAREAIEKGVLAEFVVSLEEAETIIKEWRNAQLDNKQAYHKLFAAIMEQNKHIARRYDDMRGSRYLLTVAAILHDGYITEEDIKDFSEEVKEQINLWISFWKRDE